MNTILFDLDGTLLPMDEKEFIKIYFGGLTKKAAAHGYDAQAVVSAIWEGTAAAAQNDGSRQNDQAFWEVFARRLGEGILALRSEFDSYYQNEFNDVKAATWAGETTRAIVDTFGAKGYRMVVATNPIFPRVAVETRLAWAGLTAEEFELVTSYENSRYCKPNLAYYKDILDRLKAKGEDCLMAGNDVQEDMCAGQLGMQTYLVTDCLLDRQDSDLQAYRRGSLEDFLRYAQAMPDAD